MIPGIVAWRAAGATATVEFVAATNGSYTTDVLVNAAIPAVLDGDLILAVVMHRSALTPPEGWVLVDSQSCVGSGTTQSTSIYRKTAVVADGGSSPTWIQAVSGRMGAQMVVFRKPGGIAAVLATAKVAENDKAVSPNVYPIPAITGTSSGQRAFAATSYVFSGAGTMSVSAGWALATQANIADRRIASAHQAISAGLTLSGQFTSTLESSANGIASVSVLIG